MFTIGQPEVCKKFAMEIGVGNFQTGHTGLAVKTRPLSVEEKNCDEGLGSGSLKNPKTIGLLLASGGGRF